jgi:sugar phosphate isomerase/epimerase
MAKLPIALQLYSVRDDCARDLPGTLKAVANMGYDGVEFAGYYGRSADELRKMLEWSGTEGGRDQSERGYGVIYLSGPC